MQAKEEEEEEEEEGGWHMALQRNEGLRSCLRLAICMRVEAEAEAESEAEAEAEAEADLSLTAARKSHLIPGWRSGGNCRFDVSFGINFEVDDHMMWGVL